MNASVDTFSSHEAKLQALRDVLQARLGQLLPEEHEHDLVAAAMREGTLVPGKRIRPLLLLLTAQDLGCPPDRPGLLDLACAVEMIHAASLMLDDIPCMDGALLRRGRPTIHRQFGENVAILAAVALLSRAYGVVTEAEALSDSCKTQAVTALSRAAGLEGLVQGQFRDLSEGCHPRSADAIVSTNTLKTATLFEATLQMAALAANASPGTRQMLKSFAQHLGQAFQLLDDLSDSSGDTGKDVNQDSGKSTLVAMLGPAAVRQRLQEHLRRADAHLTEACGSTAVTRGFINDWFDKQLAMFG